jgi:predicted permease
MPLFPHMRSLGRTLFRGKRLERDLDDEVRGYLENLTQKKIAEGLDPASARRAALIEMGGVEPVKESARAARLGIGVETTLRDARYAWRSLWRSPGFALATILTLGLGIGASTAIFSVVDAMLLSPLPYRDSSRLVFVWSDMTEAGYPRAPLSGPELGDLRQRATLFEGFGAIWANSAALTGDGEPQRLRVGFVTTDFFAVLGAGAALGRTFAAEDEAKDAPPSILLSAALWRRRFGGDSEIVGRRIVVNGRPTTVVGVMPAAFRLLLPTDSSVPDDLEAFLPFRRGVTESERGQQYLRVVGRLKPGVTLAQGRREVDAIAARISKEFSEYGSAGRRYVTVSLHADGVREIRPVLLALFAGVGILLLITCVNVAGLLAARAAARREEIALRIALGAGRLRLFRQCLVEGVVLALLGACVGIVVARAALLALVAARPESLSRIAAATIDGRVLAFTAGTALLWGVLLSLAPLAEVLRTSTAAGLRRAGQRVQGRTRTVLVAVQVALGVVLVVGAGLVARSFVRLQGVDPGFVSDHVLSFRLGLGGGRGDDPHAFNAFGRTFEKEVAALPGVTAVAAVSHLPFDHIPNWGGPYLATPVAPGADETTAPMADYRAVTPGFFAAAGAHLLAGRGFTEADDENAQPVVMVDERLARLTWPNKSAIGQRLGLDPQSNGHPSSWATVVGVVRHLRHTSLLEDVREQVYFPQRQINRNPVAYLVRTRSDPAVLAAPIRGILARLDPALPISEVRLLDGYVTAARGAQRFTMILAAAFAAAALLLACIGLYGVVAYAVTLRRREFGVRMALGALPLQVRMLVLRDGMRIAGVGLVLGLPAALAASRLLRSQLYGVTPRDAASYALAVAILSLAAVGASWFAARRATSASPLEVLRAE